MQFNLMTACFLATLCCFGPKAFIGIDATVDDDTGDISDKGDDDNDNEKEYIFEVLVFVDLLMVPLLAERLPEQSKDLEKPTDLATRMVHALFNNVKAIYLNEGTLGRKIRVEVLQIIYVEDGAFDKAGGVPRQFNINFCKYVNKLNYTGDSHPKQYDMAIFISSTSLVVNGKKGPSGNAFTGSVCDRRTSCGIVDGTVGLKALSIIIAHELGHGIGMSHDTSKQCPPWKFVMSAGGGYDLNGDWSTCSRDALEKFLKKPKSTCLFNDPRKSKWNVIEVGDKLPGQLFGSSEQCAYQNGADWTVFEGPLGSLKEPGYVNDLCKDLFCKIKSGPLAVKGMRGAMDGTPCGEDRRTMGCYDKQCVPLSDIPKDRFMGTH